MSVDIDDTDSIDEYEKLFMDSYKGHSRSMKLQSFAKKIIEEDNYSNENLSESYIDVNSGEENYNNVKTREENYSKVKSVGECSARFKSATAEGRLFVGHSVMQKMVDTGKIGHFLSVAQVAGVMGAKKTHDLIPFCFDTSAHKVDITVRPDEKTAEVVVITEVKDDGKDNEVNLDVRSKALTGCSIALITIQDMICRNINRTSDDNGFAIRDIRLKD